MKKSREVLIIISIILLALISSFFFIRRINKKSAEKYYVDLQFETNQFDLSVVDSLPQQLLDKKDFGSTVKLKVRCKDFLNDFDNTEFSKENSDLQKYLQETEYIDFNNPSVKSLSEKLNLSSLSTVESAKTVLQNINQSTGFITYDQELAQEISYGNTYGRSAGETLNVLKGTCGEFANVFNALMRLNNIPCKFIQGYCITPNGSSLHAWAEFYDENKGWIPVDPQAGMFGVSPYHVKVFEAVDFPSTSADFSSLCFGNTKIISSK